MRATSVLRRSTLLKQSQYELLSSSFSYSSVRIIITRGFLESIAGDKRFSECSASSMRPLWRSYHGGSGQKNMLIQRGTGQAHCRAKGMSQGHIPYIPWTPRNIPADIGCPINHAILTNVVRYPRRIAGQASEAYVVLPQKKFPREGHKKPDQRGATPWSGQRPR